MVQKLAEKEEGNMSDNAQKENEARRCSVFLTPAREDFAYLDRLIRETCAGFDLPPLNPM